MRTVTNKDTLSIIGDRYLDIKFDGEYIDNIEAELQKRGVTGLYRWALEYIAASSLWWSIIWWDMYELTAKDMKVGWWQNLVVFGLLVLSVSWLFNVYVGLTVLMALHLGTLWLGLRLRAATKA